MLTIGIFFDFNEGVILKTRKINQPSAATVRLTAQLSNNGGKPKTQSRKHVIKK